MAKRTKQKEQLKQNRKAGGRTFRNAYIRIIIIAMYIMTFSQKTDM